MTTQPTRVQAPVCTLGEGPVWDARDQSLYWVDIPESRVHQIAADGSLSSWDTGQPVGTVVPRASGGLAVAVRDGFMALDPASGALTTLAGVERDQPGNRMNDGACDRAGRFYAGTMADDESPGAGALYRLDPDLSVTRLVTGVGTSNGIGWSPDERLMYYTDSQVHRVDVFDYDPATGQIEGRRPFAAVGKGDVVPDGLTVDADGGVWVAVWGGYALLHHDPAGSVIETVDLPAAQVTSCVFGGPDLNRLYITTAAGPGESAGALFVCEPGVTGQPSHPFRG
jgi:sugar lactone lactonase YvrE